VSIVAAVQQLNARVAEREDMNAALHFALTRLWIREFQREPNPAAAAERFATEIAEALPQVPEYEKTRAALLGLFEQIASELRPQAMLS